MQHCVFDLQEHCVFIEKNGSFVVLIQMIISVEIMHLIIYITSIQLNFNCLYYNFSNNYCYGRLSPV